MLTTAQADKIRAEARPYIKRQMDDAKVIAGFRDMVTAAGGDWSALKAVIKAELQDEDDDAGDAKKVGKLSDKAEWTRIYLDMFGHGVGNLNEFYSSADDPPHDEDGVIIENNEPASVPPTSAAVVEAQPLDNAEEGGVRQPSSAPNSVAPTLAADTEGFNPALIAEELSPSSSAPNSQPVDEHDARDDRSPVAADAHATDKTGDRANGGGSDEAVTARPNSTQQAGAGEGETSSAPGSNVTQFPQPKGRRWMHSDAAHKDCLDPGQCGGFSNNGLCGRCKEAAGFVQVPHEGIVRA